MNVFIVNWLHFFRNAPAHHAGRRDRHVTEWGGWAQLLPLLLVNKYPFPHKNISIKKYPQLKNMEELQALS